MDKIDFQWDDNKAEINFRKHKISFEEAETVFEDQNAVLFDDPDHSDNEDRFLLLGMSVKLRLLIVCHCVREGEKIRIISSRKATKSESNQYYEINQIWREL